MAAPKKSRKPFQTVKSGNVSIPIYQGSVRGENGTTHDAFTVAGYITDQRRRWTFGALNDAVAKAKELADSISNGQAELLGWRRQQQCGRRWISWLIGGELLDVVAANDL